MPGVSAWTQPPAPHCQSQAPQRPRRGPTRKEGWVTAPSDEEDTEGPHHDVRQGARKGPQRWGLSHGARCPLEQPGHSHTGPGPRVRGDISRMRREGRAGRGGIHQGPGPLCVLQRDCCGGHPPKPEGCCRWAGGGEEEARTVTSPALSRPHVDKGTSLGHCEAGGLPPGDPVASQEPHPGPHCPGLSRPLPSACFLQSPRIQHL